MIRFIPCAAATITASEMATSPSATKSIPFARCRFTAAREAAAVDGTIRRRSKGAGERRGGLTPRPPRVAPSPRPGPIFFLWREWWFRFPRIWRHKRGVRSAIFLLYKQKQARNGRIFPHSGLVGRSKKVPSVTPDVFSRSFLCWWLFFLRFELKKVFCFLNRKHKTRNQPNKNNHRHEKQ